jgi:TRAP-type mannitol/chloroaromatic compound transport system permease large subunit
VVADRRLLDQTLVCPSCGGLCEPQRSPPAIPPHDPRITDQLIGTMITRQEETIRLLGWIFFGVVILTLIAACGLIGGFTLKLQK